MPYDRMSDYGTEEDMIAAVTARLYSSRTVEAGVTIHVVDKNDLPDFYFFDAWEWSD